MFLPFFFLFCLIWFVSFFCALFFVFSGGVWCSVFGFGFWLGLCFWDFVCDFELLFFWGGVQRAVGCAGQKQEAISHAHNFLQEAVLFCCVVVFVLIRLIWFGFGLSWGLALRFDCCFWAAVSTLGFHAGASDEIEVCVSV